MREQWVNSWLEGRNQLDVYDILLSEFRLEEEE